MIKDIPQIGTINVTLFQNELHLSTLQQLLSVINAYRAKLDPAQLPSKAEQMYTLLAAGLEEEDRLFIISMASQYTERIAELDAQRDDLYTKLKRYVDMMATIDFDPQKQQAAQQVQRLMQTYPVNVNSAHDKESTYIAQWLQEQLAEGSAQAQAAETLGLTAQLTQLKQANDELSRLWNLRVEEKSGKTGEQLKTQRTQNDSLWRQLVQALNAYATLATDETQYADLFQQLNAHIQSARERYEQRRRENAKDRQVEIFNPEKSGQTSGTVQGRLFRIAGAGYEPVYRQWNISGGNTLVITSLDQKRLINRVELTIASRSQKKWGDDNTASRGTATAKGSIVTIAGVDYTALTIESSGAIDKPLYVAEVRVYY